MKTVKFTDCPGDGAFFYSSIDRPVRRRGLWRVLGRKDSDGYESTLTWVMLNPSTATAHVDDPTIRKIKKFTGAFGYSRLLVLNLCDIMSTDPKFLPGLIARHGVVDDGSDVFVNENLDEVCERNRGRMEIMFAWGANASIIPELEQRIEFFIDAAESRKLKIMSLGLTKKLQPKHPLYLKDSTKMSEVFRDRTKDPTGN